MASQPPNLSSNIDPWCAFRALCGLYADCVTASENMAEIHDMARQNTDFRVIQPPPRWLDDNHAGTDFSLDLSGLSDRGFHSTLTTYKAFDEEVYIAYPCIFYHGRKTPHDHFMVPVCLIPVHIRFLDAYIVRITPHPERALLNEKTLERLLTPDTFRRLQSAAIGDNTINLLLSVLSTLSHLTQTNLDPNSPNAFVRPAEDKKPQNIAMLCVGMALRYNRTLRRELKQIAGMPSNVLDSTALAYVFRNPPLPSPPRDPTQTRIPLGFLDSNDRQFRALLEALNAPCNKIQGPPGTGKSYTAVNLLLNLAANGESALFTSKNHQAIHAIDDLVAACIEGKDGQGLGFDVIQFCSAPDDKLKRHAWYQADTNSLKGKACMLAHASPALDLAEANARYRELSEAFRKLWRDLERRRSLVIETERLEYDIATLSQLCKIDPPQAADAITRAALRIAKESEKDGWFHQLWFRLLGGAKRLAEAEATLRRKYPAIHASKRSDLIKDIERHLEYAEKLLRQRKASQKAQTEAAMLPSYDLLLKEISTILKGLSATATPLLRLRIAERAETLDSALIPKLKNLTNQLPNGDIPFYATQAGKQLRHDLEEAFHQFTECFPIWACTLLSLPLASPCSPGLFDRVIIDEAAQCDIPSMIPALFRAKAVTVIGDPEQFPPINQISDQRYALLRKNAGYPPDYDFGPFCYRDGNAFNVVPGAALMLEEHRRCADGIAAYFSDTFYGGNLQVVESPPPGKEHDPLLQFPSYMGYKAALTWESVSGTDEEEFRRVEQCLDRIMQLPQENRAGLTIGIVSPLRRVAEALKDRLGPYFRKFPKNVLDEASIGTAYAFQGGTKGIIFFVLGLNTSTQPGERWYIEDAKNRSIYNVAISRAKVCCIVVGDRERAQKSSLPELRKLASPPTETHSRDASIGPGEIVLQTALEHLGLKPIPQYRLLNRKLDLALPESRLDIEVDGAAWHLNERGNRNQDDLFRDLQVESVGWYPFRVWHKEVMEDPTGVAKRILELHNQRLHS